MDNNLNFFLDKGNLSYLNIISLESFHVLGYECLLWTYSEIPNVPDYVEICDANEIIPLNPNVDIILFSDIFRYNLLYKHGGWWSDIDNICVNKLPTTEYLISGNNILAARDYCFFLNLKTIAPNY